MTQQRSEEETRFQVFLKLLVFDVCVCIGLCDRGQQTGDPSGPAPCGNAVYWRGGNLSYTERGAVCMKCKSCTYFAVST